MGTTTRSGLPSTPAGCRNGRFRGGLSVTLNCLAGRVLAGNKGVQGGAEQVVEWSYIRSHNASMPRGSFPARSCSEPLHRKLGHRRINDGFDDLGRGMCLADAGRIVGSR